ncbi:hypothetical protein Tco_0778967 [Tanacetum coccineum]
MFVTAVLTDEGKAKAIAINEIDKDPKEKETMITIATAHTKYETTQRHYAHEYCPYYVKPYIGEYFILWTVFLRYDGHKRSVLYDTSTIAAEAGNNSTTRRPLTGPRINDDCVNASTSSKIQHNSKQKELCLHRFDRFPVKKGRVLFAEYIIQCPSSKAPNTEHNHVVHQHSIASVMTSTKAARSSQHTLEGFLALVVFSVLVFGIDGLVRVLGVLGLNVGEIGLLEIGIMEN